MSMQDEIIVFPSVWVDDGGDKLEGCQFFG